MPLHIVLHIALPLAAALVISRFSGYTLGRAFLLLVAGIVIDLDHLLANPIFDPTRCSIGFHPLHTWPAVVVYALLLLPKWTRLFGLGLLIHIGLDASDCVWQAHG